MKYIDDESKKLYWWNRNYFFAGTIIIVLLNIIIFAFVSESQSRGSGAWNAILEFDNLARVFRNGFFHSNWQHVLLNMLCFLICGAWLERRKGSLALILLVLVMNIVTGAFVGANHQSLSFHGYSGVNFGLYAYAIIDYCFLFRKPTRTKINVISGAVLMGLIYFASCFAGGTSSVTFRWYPYDFMHNMGHYSSFLAGVILGLTIQLVKLATVREIREQGSEQGKEESDELMD